MRSSRVQLLVVFVACFVAFGALMTLLNWIGVPDRVIGCLFVAVTISVFVVTGFVNRTMQPVNFFVAGRSIPALFNGMATAAAWCSVISFLGLGGALFDLGFDALAYVLGLAGGLVLVAALFAPYLRKSGAFSVPDFLAARFNSRAVRLAAVAVLLAVTLLLLISQIHGAALVASAYLGVRDDFALYVVLVCILACTVFGGMRALTWTHVAQGVVVFAAILVPALWISFTRTGIPAPWVMYGQALAAIDTLTAAQSVQPYTQPFVHLDRLNFGLTVLCLMIGVASMPQILMHSLTPSSVRAARSSAVWALFFVAVMLATMTATMAFVRWSFLELLTAGLTPQTIAEKAGWLIRWGAANSDLVAICGKAASSVEVIAAACAERGVSGALGLKDVEFAPELVMFAGPEISGLPHSMSALVATGAIAASLAAATGLVFAAANAISHDLYYKLLDRNAPVGRRLVVARAVVIVFAAGAAYASAGNPTTILTAFSWAFSIAAAGLFPALVLAVWWKRATAPGVLAGMVAALVVTLYYLLATRYGAVTFFDMWSGLSDASPDATTRFTTLEAAYERATGEAQAAAWTALSAHAQTIANWWGIKGISAAALGVPVGFLTALGVSLITRRPSAETQLFVDQLKIPRGAVLISERTA